LESVLKESVVTAEVNASNERVVPVVQVGGNCVYLFVKRLFDVVVSIFAGVLLFVPMLLIAGLIHMDSAGPVIYKQERLGKNGKSFIMYKFRTMCLDAEADGPKWAEKEDKRCTDFGLKLRKMRLDELPQLWNILKGDMSFVGPRPERPFFYDEFEVYIPEFRNRLLVKPGLTGHAQVNGGYDLLPEEKIIYDMEYIKNRSLKMDIQCIWKTVMIIFSHDGAR